MRIKDRVYKSLAHSKHFGTASRIILSGVSGGWVGFGQADGGEGRAQALRPSGVRIMGRKCSRDKADVSSDPSSPIFL